MSLWCAVAVPTQSAVLITPPTLRGIEISDFFAASTLFFFVFLGKRLEKMVQRK